MNFKTFKMFEEESLILDTRQKVQEWLDSMNIRNYTINDDLNVDVDGNVDLSGQNFERIPVKFGKIKGYFNCRECSNLISLKGSPKEVLASFWCDNCPNLVSLECAPKEVGRDFYCNECSKLVSLEGSPKTVGGFFSCDKCKNLSSFEGGPEIVKGNFHCTDCPNLVSLEGSPKTVGGDFICIDCPNLISLINFPLINGSLYHKNTPIENLFNNDNFKDFSRMSDQEKENFIIEAYKENRVDERVFKANVSKEKQLYYKGLVSGKKFGI